MSARCIIDLEDADYSRVTALFTVYLASLSTITSWGSSHWAYRHTLGVL